MSGETTGPPRADLDALIDKGIRAMSRLAYDHNPFLHGLFESAGINPHRDISGRTDLLKAYRKGVRTTGEDIPKLYADYAPRQSVFEIWSSGSSGVPKRVLLSSGAMERARRGKGRIFAAAGVTDGERVLAFPAPPPYSSSVYFTLMASLEFPKIRLLQFRLPQLPKDISSSEKERLARTYVSMIHDFAPQNVYGGVWALKDFARFLTDYGLKKEVLSVNNAFYGGDAVTDAERREIGELWGAEPFARYASTEGGTIAYECRSHTGLHVNEPDIFLTSVDPRTSEEVGEGEPGKDLCTCLYEDGKTPATFFINYSHSDNVTLLKGGCACGRSSKLMGHPTRDFRKKPISGFGFDVKEHRSVFSRGVRRVRRTIR